MTTIPQPEDGRVPDVLDPDLLAVASAADVIAKIAEATAAMGRASRPDHYPRAVIACSDGDGGPPATHTPGAALFSILQFNLLAEGLSSGPDVPAPFEFKKASGFGGFDAVQNPEVCMDWGLRKWRLVEEMLRYDPDLITFQECDHFYDFFLPVMEFFGYKGVFNAKEGSPCLNFGYYSDGVGIFYKIDVWSDQNDPITAHYTAPNGGKGNPYVICKLLHRASRTRVLVATTHLKAKISVANELLRENQVGQLLDAIKREAAQWPGSAIIFAGDHNADAYDVTDKGVVVPATCVPSVAASTDPALESVYPLPTSEADMYTTWKKRGAYEARHTIDYIWHTQHKLKPVARLGVVAEAELEPWRLPGFRYPSDHLSLWARFELVGSEVTAGSNGGGGGGGAGGGGGGATGKGVGRAKIKATSATMVGFGLTRGGGSRAGAGAGAGASAGSDLDANVGVAEAAATQQTRSAASSSPRQVVPAYLLAPRGPGSTATWNPVGNPVTSRPEWQPDPYNGGHGTPAKSLKQVNSAGAIREHRKGSASGRNGGGGGGGSASSHAPRDSHRHASGTRMRHGSSSSSFRSEAPATSSTTTTGRQRGGSTSSRGSSGSVSEDSPHSTYYRGATAGRTWRATSPNVKGGPGKKHSEFPEWMPEPYTGGHGVPPPGAMAETREFADPASRAATPRGGLGASRGVNAQKLSESPSQTQLRTMTRTKSSSSRINKRSSFASSRKSTDLDDDATF